MTTAAKHVLSGSTGGKAIVVAATAIGSGTTIHTTSTGVDLVTLFAHNIDTVPVTLTVGWGETGTAWSIPIPAASTGGLTLLTEQMPLENSLVIKMAASTASKILIFGDAVRLT